MTRLWLIDFEDSFTFNVAAELERSGARCEVLPWTHLRDPVRREESELPQLIVLGPGPGHPDEYGVGPRLATWWTTGVPLAGICLGHQLIARMLGLRVERSTKPLHGETVSPPVPLSWQRLGLPQEITVQRYNSLGVPVLSGLPEGWEGWEYEGEYIGLKHRRAMSYQFHPESVGTSCPRELFRPLLDLAL